jgi:hypothetical protein
VGYSETFWTDGFESYMGGDTINSLGTTWVVPAGFTTGHAFVHTSRHHSGSKCLALWSPGRVAWYDDTPSAPHGGLIEISWWMLLNYSPNWEVAVIGRDDANCMILANAKAGSTATVEAYTSSGWVETASTVPLGQWQKIWLEVDLGSDPDIYRFRAGDESAAWSDWYTLGSNEQVFRRLEFRSPSGGQVFLDDFAAQAPEPASLCLLGLGMVPLIRRRRPR